jgi:hypothetical protein
MSYEGMTWNDLVRKYFPNANDKECDFLLWEKTAFPLVPVEEVEKQLQEYQVMWLSEKRSNYVGEENIYQ